MKRKRRKESSDSYKESKRRNSRDYVDNWSFPAMTIPSISRSNLSSSSSSPSPPRYSHHQSFSNQSQPSSSRASSKSLLMNGRSIEECRARIRQEMENLKNEEDSRESKIETIELQSDSDDEIYIEKDQKHKSQITIENLDVNVTEMEIRKSLRNVSGPNKISLSRFSGKCDATLYFDDRVSADQFKEKLQRENLISRIQQSKNNDSGGVSPPRYPNYSQPIQILEESLPAPARKSKLVVPIFLDIQSEDGASLSKIKVHLYLFGKCQQFLDQEPRILISAFLNYMKKYFPSKDDHEFILVTSCPASYTLFYSVLKENPVNKQVFDFYFRSWSCLQTIVNIVAQDRRVLQGCFYQQSKETLQKQIISCIIDSSHYQRAYQISLNLLQSFFSLDN